MSSHLSLLFFSWALVLVPTLSFAASPPIGGAAATAKPVTAVPTLAAPPALAPTAEASLAVTRPGTVAEAAAAAEAAANSAARAATSAEEAATALRTLTRILRDDDGDEAAGGKEDEDLSFQLSLNGLANFGNAYAAAARLTSSVTSTWGPWSLNVAGSAAYGEAQAQGKIREVTAYNAKFSVRGDRNLRPRLGTYLALTILTDRIASYRSQITAEPGLTLLWWERKLAEDFVKSRLQTSLGLRTLREDQYQYYPVAQVIGPPHYLVGPTTTLALRYGLTRNAYFEQSVDAYLVARNSVDAATSMGPLDLRLTSVSNLVTQISAGTAINVAVTARYFGRPAPGKSKTAQELTAGITWGW